MDFSDQITVLLENIGESVVDSERRILSSHVFDVGPDGYRLKKAVRSKIFRGIDQIRDITPTARVLIVGSILTFNYSDKSDVDVTVQVIAPSTEETEKIRELLNTLNGEETAGPHEINYFCRTTIDLNTYEAAYDVPANVWLKEPRSTTVDITKYLDEFDRAASKIDLNKGELFRDIIDYEILQDLSDDEVVELTTAAQSKLDEIETSVEKLVTQYKELRNNRKAIENPNPAELRQYGFRAALPQNVIYVLMRKYCYLEFMITLKSLNKGGIEQDDIDDIKSAFTSLDTCSI